jgi:hypothetical protein
LYPQRVQSLLRHPAVESWLGRAPKKSTVYIFNMYLKWRREKGLPDDPDLWIDECLNGNNLTLIRHLKTLLEWAEGPSLDGLSDASRVRYYCVVRSFYRKNFASLPEANLKVRKEASEVSMETTATEFIQMMKRVFDAGRLSIRDRSMMLTMLQAGLDD